MTPMLHVHHPAPDLWLLTPGPDRALPATPAPLPLRGGLLAVDVMAPDAPPWAEVHDLNDAQAWIGDLYGTELLSTLSALTEPRRDPIAQSGAPFPTDHLLTRLALGRWLHRWWPSADALGIARLDQHLLRAELGALAWAVAEDHLELDEPHEDWLGPREWRAVTAAIDVDPGTFAARRLAYARAIDLIARCAEDLEPPEPGIDRLLDARLHWRAEPVTPGTVTIAQDRFALTAGGNRQPTGIDLWLVPPRSVSAREDALTWRELAASVTIEVGVGDEPTESLTARAYAAGEVLPQLCTLSRVGALYRGTLHNEAAGPIELVEVFQPGMARRPADALLAREWRERVRRVAAVRTSAASRGAAVGGVSPFVAEILATNNELLT